MAKKIKASKGAELRLETRGEIKAKELQLSYKKAKLKGTNFKELTGTATKTPSEFLAEKKVENAMKAVGRKRKK